MYLKTLLSCCMAVQTAWAAKPNIVVIYADDLGFGDISCQGATAVSTPNIDSLAASGTRFTDAHSSAPTCTPSRYSLLTGEYAWRTPGTGIAAGNAGLIIRPGSVTLPSMLRQAGYATGAVGKWHLGLGTGTTNFNAEIKPGPLEIGFDYFFGLPATSDRVPCVYLENHSVFQLRHPGDPGYVANPGPLVVSYNGKLGDDPTQDGIGTSIAALSASPLLRPIAPYTGNGGRTTYQGDAQHANTIINGIARIGYMDGGENARWDDDTMAFQLTAKASDFIATHAASAQPFFLYYAAHDIHVPHAPNVQFQGTSSHGIRGDSIHQFDWQVGAILSRLNDPNGDGNPADSVLDNTLVIFSSDNGPVLGDGYYDGASLNPGNHDINGPYKGGKYSVNEGGHRIPFIVRWPGHVPAGQVSTALLSQADLLASLASLTGQALPLDAGPDSENVLPALLGQTQQGRTLLVNQNDSTAKAIRSGPLKYYFADSAFYNLAADPGEVTNILAANSTTATAMKAVYDKIAATPMSTTAAGWWPLDAQVGAAARDLSGLPHAGVLAGSPAWMSESGKPFLRFDGSTQSASITGAGATTGDFSAMLWARSNATTWSANSCLISRRPQFALETIAGTKQVSMVVHTTAGTAQRLNFDLSTLPAFDLTAWHHYALRWDTSTGLASLFIDGSERVHTTFSTAGTGTGGRIDLAVDASSFLACDLSDVRLYASALTPERIARAGTVRLMDNDADGMLDDWETAHLLDPFNAADATLDPDNDGLTNLAEFHAGSDPQTNSVTGIGQWDLDDGSGTTAIDSSSYQRNGTLLNGPAWMNAAGRKFLSFDGTNDYVEVPSFPNFTSNVTVSCWARSHTANWNAAGCIISRRGQWILHPWLNPAGSNRISFLVVRSDNAAEVNAQFDLATLPGFDIRQWHHYAGTYEGTTGTVKLYVDGTLRATTTIPPMSLKTSTNPLRIGSDSFTTARFFNGDVDQVKIVEKAFSAADVMALTSGFDDDQDGLPDDFERKIINASGNTLPNLSDVKPGDDFDRDGHTNLEESVAGTDPTSATDYLKHTSFSLADDEANSSFSVQVQARPGRTYELEESINLQPPWSSVQSLGPFTSDQLIELVQPTLPGPKGFYRVRVKVAGNP